MSGWSILIRGMACFTGVVCFLRLVSLAVMNSQDMLKLLEEHEETRYKQRLDAGASEAPLVVGAVGERDDEEPITVAAAIP